MLNPLFIDAVAARLMRVGHYTNVDAVKDAMADVAKAMDADLPSNVVAELRVALAKSQKDCIERGQIVIATQAALVKAHEENMTLTDELADAKKTIVALNTGLSSNQVSGQTSTQTDDPLTNLSEETPMPHRALPPGLVPPLRSQPKVKAASSLTASLTRKPPVSPSRRTTDGPGSGQA